MQEFHEGDLVEAVKGESVMRARLVKDGEHLRLNPSPYFIPKIEILLKDGYTLTVIEKATPPLPTEPGWYATDFKSNVFSLFDGAWREHSASRVWERTEEEAREALKWPPRRLEPVPVTAKRVLDAVIARTVMHCNGCSSHMFDIRAEFGVTE